MNRRVRVRPQNPVTRAQILELLLGPNGSSVFASEAQARELWAELQLKYSPDFASKWYAAHTEHKPFAEIARQYALQVEKGEIPACRWTRLACRRHLDDLEKAERDPAYPYRFDASKADRACRFLELLPHVKGEWAAVAQTFTLEPWQVFCVCVLFGWVKRASNLRRFTMAYFLIPRKNGKSFLAAGIGLYLFACDGEFGSEVYSGATTERQAHEVFRPAQQMIARSPELAQALGVVAQVKRISRPEDGSRFEVVVGRPGDGSSPHGGLVDEYHEHDSDALVDTFRTGMGARRQPVLLIISTAGDNTQGPCKLLQADAEKILEGQLQREDVFAIIYSIDPGDSWTAVDSLAKANPNLGVSVSREFLVAEQQAAILNPRKQGIFLIKHLDVWVGAVANYFDKVKWEALGSPQLNITDYIGLPCVVASDLSTKRDFTARVVCFKKTQAGKAHYYLFTRFYLPQSQVDQPSAAHYKDWAGKYIRVHEGATVDFERIIEETCEEVARVRAREFAFDPWNAMVLAQEVGKRTKAAVAEIEQSAKRLSPGMKELDEAIASGRVHHDGNPVMAWMIGNVMGREDANENVLPRKEPGREENKIDGAAAAIMAIGRLLLLQDDRVRYTGLRSVAC